MKFKRLVIPARDGIQLAVDLYAPPNYENSGLKYPALLEALPYRKDDLTSSSHSEDYERLSGENGFVVCRLDLRGTGSSSGLATDEYPTVELDDLNDVIDWLATQSWSNGLVGMFGYSYSGFNSLQAACTRPKALKAICAIYATDDRYTDDVHYMGGGLRQIDLVDYCHYMTTCNAMPPVPAVFGDNWRQEWQQRLDLHTPWVLNWLEQQHDSAYWRHGSLRPDYGRIACPTMIVAGWADGYRNNTLRTFAALECEKSLLFGPWSHTAPARSRPGPHIDLVDEMATWFSRWLKPDAPISNPPSPIRVFVRHATKPQPDLEMMSGVWRNEETWPPTRLKHVTFTPPSNGSDSNNIDIVASKADVGTAGWNSCAGGLPWGQPTDQREDDSWSLTYDFKIEGSDLEILGHALLDLTLTSDQPVAALSAKLCSVFPDGTSALVSRGYLNLTHRESSTNPRPLTPGKSEDITLELEATSWVFPVGHTLRLSLAGNDWPNIWPSPQQFELGINRETVKLKLPTLSGPGAGVPQFKPVEPPTFSALQPSENGEFPATLWRVENDVIKRTRTAHTFYGGESEIRDGGIAKEWYSGECGVHIDNPANAWIDATTRYNLIWPQVNADVTSTMTIVSDADYYTVTIDLLATENGNAIARKNWHRKIARLLA